MNSAHLQTQFVCLYFKIFSRFLIFSALIFWILDFTFTFPEDIHMFVCGNILFCALDNIIGLLLCVL